MTVINNIEIDNIQYNRNHIKDAINNNEPIEDKLHVIIVVSNPCLFARRFILLKEFVQRVELEEPNIYLYIVELAYGKEKFYVTNEKNKRHLQLRTEHVLWHKENMVNVGIKKLLPPDWKAVAWVDADIEFENTTWAMDTLKVLNGSKDIVQLFSHCVDMNQYGQAMNVFPSFGFQYTKKLPYSKKPVNFWHPGYAWACTRKFYEKIGGLYEQGILGSGDNIMALSFIQKVEYASNKDYTKEYADSMYDFQEKTKLLRIGYIPGVIRHYYHGSKKNRNYENRWKILINYGYKPDLHFTKDANGILIPKSECPEGLLKEIINYFKSRNDDEMYEGGDYSKRIRNVIEKDPEFEFQLEDCTYDIEEDSTNDDDAADDDDVKPFQNNFLSGMFHIFQQFVNPGL
jgi:hypothetical protein